MASLGPRGRYAKSSFLGQLIFAATAFGGSVLAARLFGPGGKGELTAWTLGALTGAFVLAGPIPTGLGRAYLRSEHRALVSAAARHGGIALVPAIICSVVAIAGGIDPVAVLSFILISVPALVTVGDLLVVMQAAKRPWWYHAPRVVSAAVLTLGLGIIALARSHVQLHVAFMLSGAGSLCAVVVAMGLARRISQQGVHRDLRFFASLGHGSYTANLIDFLLLRVDQFFAVAIAGPVGLGLYSVAVGWSEICQYVGSSIALGSFEDERTLGRSAARRLLARATVVLAALGLLVAVAGFVLIGPVFGESFEPARWALLILIPGVVARGRGATSAQMLLARGEGKRLSRIMILNLAVAIPAWTLLTWLAGIEGTALATTGAYFLQMVLADRAVLGSAGRFHSSSGS